MYTGSQLHIDLQPEHQGDIAWGPTQTHSPLCDGVQYISMALKM